MSSKQNMSLFQVTEFFTEERLKDAAIVKRTLTQSIEKVRESINWLKENKQIAIAWLEMKLKKEKAKK